MTSEPKTLVVLREEPEAYSPTQTAFRAYRGDDGSPLYLGAFTAAALEQRVRDSYGHWNLEFKVECS